MNDFFQRFIPLIKSIPDILRAPGVNPTQTLTLIGILILIIVIVALLIAFPLLKPRKPPFSIEESEAEEVEETKNPVVKYRPSRLNRFITGFSLAIVFLFVLWISIGISTANSVICVSCHGKNVHPTTNNLHANVQCIDCHENNQTFTASVGNTIARLQHFTVASNKQRKYSNSYGTPVSSFSCAFCHEREISAMVTDTKHGIKMSHREPLQVGASCLDCHALAKGIVSVSSAGMKPCLRCHDGKIASAECQTCHTKDAADAQKDRIDENKMASILVPTPNCASCHTNQKRCDTCHGLRLPHSADFQKAGHAREAVKDIWNNNGKTCGRCHTSTHNSCQQTGCHTSAFPQHGLSWKQLHQSASWSKSNLSCSCHSTMAIDKNRNFCLVCHNSKPPGARP